MKAIIDRFEGDYAVLLFKNEEIQVDFPKKLLPEEVTEGDVLTINIEIDRDERERRREAIKTLFDKIKNKR
ncbi:Protein of unknown function [Anaerobranca californiensis DSM 14826]|jgi:hypothetical protein|uniref:DUF3006 domain-containing protein n=1 Tax=Anaerobranca californiensis DSM 14826 TaxID=1120989 RepID=A0A1M6LLG6_9FIRM|nr:DUF3006 domain-containing protein [Anaerobranca californiensis]SHJ72015.1 Protein of unknown function [Anaerobranca californiensis DSM 14826]